MPRGPTSSRHAVLAAAGAAVVLALCIVGRHLAVPKPRPVPATGSDSPAATRITSLAPSITEIVYAVGAGEELVGVTRYCDYPPEAASKAKIGGYYDPNYEAILAARPDLAIMLPEHEAPREYLEQQGIRVLTVDHKTIDGILASITSIGAACGRDDGAARLVADLRARRDAVVQRVAGRPRPAVMITVGRDMSAESIRDLYVAGTGGWYSQMVHLAGGRNAYDGPLMFPAVSAEGVLKMDPDVIVEMLGDMSGTGFEAPTAMTAWQSLPSVAAVRSGRVHTMTEDFVVTPGPRFVQVLDHLATLLHPDT